jgi:peptide/nickel transport system permease protein
MSAPTVTVLDELTVASEIELESAPPKLWRAVLRGPEGRIGLALAIAMVGLIVIGPLIAPFPPDKVAAGLPLQNPSFEHWLGTDQLGRDVLSRFLSGGGSVLLVPLVAVVLAFLLGGGLGILGAYRRDVYDSVITRAFDLLLAMPPLLLVMVLVAGLGTSTPIVIATVALVYVPRAGRIVRGAAQAVVTSDYVAAAQARGERTLPIMLREILPNAAAPSLAAFTLYLTYAIIFVATLSFLGLGAQPPSSDWGLMVSENRGFLLLNPWGTLAPIFGIVALSVSWTLIAEGVSRHVTRDSDAGEVIL